MSRTVFQVRCSEAEKARWVKQAGSRTLSDYVRFLLDGGEEKVPAQDEAVVRARIIAAQRKFIPDFKSVPAPKKRKF